MLLLILFLLSAAADAGGELLDDNNKVDNPSTDDANRASNFSEGIKVSETSEAACRFHFSHNFFPIFQQHAYLEIDRLERLLEEKSNELSRWKTKAEEVGVVVDEVFALVVVENGVEMGLCLNVTLAICGPRKGSRWTVGAIS